MSGQGGLARIFHCSYSNMRDRTSFFTYKLVLIFLAAGLPILPVYAGPLTCAGVFANKDLDQQIESAIDETAHVAESSPMAKELIMTFRLNVSWIIKFLKKKKLNSYRS